MHNIALKIQPSAFDSQRHAVTKFAPAHTRHKHQYGTLRQLRSIKRSLPSHALNTLVTRLVRTQPVGLLQRRFVGLPACDVQRLQSILNTAVRLVARSSRRDHVTSLLRDRYWLPVKQRVEYKLCTIVHRCLYGDAPSYLVDLITPSVVASARAGLRSAESMTVVVPRTLSSFGDRFSRVFTQIQ